MENDLSHLLFSKLFWTKGGDFSDYICAFSNYSMKPQTELKSKELCSLIVYCFCGDGIGTFFSILLLCVQKSELHVGAC
jgi:hypothetical protein